MPDLLPKPRNLKNRSPRHFALLNSLSTSVIVLSLLIALYYASWNDLTWQRITALTGIVFVVSYFTSDYFIGHFIFRKIKLIYKIIHDHRIPNDVKTKLQDNSINILDSVEAEVDEWAAKEAENSKIREERASYRRKFIGDVSHELKTPIFNIQGFIHTLLDGALHDPDVNRKYLERAASNADRLERIVEDLETINRLENGQLVLDLREFDIKKLVGDVFDDVELKAREKSILLQFKEGADQHFRVLADKEAIRQVLINLITNAIKYGRKNGFVKVSMYEMDEKILVEVSDNGIGITEEHLPHIFERFYRVDKSRSREQGGTGLGLSIVKHIIEAHRETIHARSDLGKGTTFGFTMEKIS